MKIESGPGQYRLKDGNTDEDEVLLYIALQSRHEVDGSGEDHSGNDADGDHVTQEL